MINCLKRYEFVANETPLCIELTEMEAVDGDEDISYTTYGLRVIGEDGRVLYSAPDVDTKRESVERFVEFCAAGEIRVIHMDDLLDDYLADR
ncbi:MAG: DUF6514 family protein [Oscillospiraceae bacterium]|nr:DUF6514 family protein [Oscillospiraceae bacterium]